MIDESDATIDAFPQHMALGYCGVSSKTCKGFYKSILNSARCRKLNLETPDSRFFMSGEDLTCQAGLSVQQDLALVAALGITHVERNAHHYVRGMQAASPSEQERFLARFPALYVKRGDVVCLDIERGAIATGVLNTTTGWGSAVEPDWNAVRETMQFTA